jgi:hypothetical protein
VTGPSLGPLSSCVFAHCAANVMLVIEQAVPGDDEATIKRVPQHQIEGDASRFGQCPASLMVVPLDAYSRESLRTMAEEIRRMLPAGDPRDPRGDSLTPRRGPDGRPLVAHEHPLTPHPDPNHPFNRGNGMRETRSGGTNVPQDGNPGRTVVPLPEGPHAGPGPGRASAPHPPRAGDVVDIVPRPKLQIIGPDTGPRKGTSNMSDTDLRAQLISLTNLAIEGFGQQQESCALLTAQLDAFAAIRRALAEKQAATHSLALAAVGSRSDVPQPAAEMIGASASIGSALDHIETAEAALRQYVDGAYASAAAAASNGQQYMAII